MSTSISEQSFQEEVLGSSIPVLVHFWAPWCGLCKMISPLLNHFQGEWSGRVRLIDINADENLRLANLYRLTTLPTLLFFCQGELVQRIDSFRGKDDLRQCLDALMQEQYLRHATAADYTPIRLYGMPLE